MNENEKVEKEEESIFRKLSKERKQLISDGLCPEWMTTAGLQILVRNYSPDDKNPKDVYERIAHQAAKHMNGYAYEWEEKFFKMMWKGWLSPSTPVLSNMGAGRNCPVSCSGGTIGDSIWGFYESQKEAALLSKNGFGTSNYLGDIRPRGSDISSGGKSSGALPVFKDFVQVSRDVSQGSTRRGAWAGYIEIDHDDFWELSTYIHANPDDANIGWIITNNFIDQLKSGNEDAIARYQRALKLKMVTGKGYFFFIDKVNELSPYMYKELNLKVKASNLCTEIGLMSDDDHTFSCVLSSLNYAKYHEWKDTENIFNALVFLDCVASDFIEIGKNIRGLEKVVRFTKKSRALGLGAMGFHTHLQHQMMPFESLEAQYENTRIFKEMEDETERASRWLAYKFGEPEWCEGFGLRNTHRIAIAPNLSSAVVCGGVSQGIEPVYKNAYIQASAAGELERVNPVLLALMKEKKVYTPETINDIINNAGSVQHVEWLSDEEKLVFKTAFEIDQHVIIRLASQRQQYIDQAQSINLFFSADAEESYISSVHQQAFEDPYIKSLYYIRSEAGVSGSTGECISCAG